MSKDPNPKSEKIEQEKTEETKTDKPTFLCSLCSLLFLVFKLESLNTHSSLAFCFLATRASMNDLTHKPTNAAQVTAMRACMVAAIGFISPPERRGRRKLNAPPRKP